jgi:hypothetical protein
MVNDRIIRMDEVVDLEREITDIRWSSQPF